MNDELIERMAEAGYLHQCRQRPWQGPPVPWKEIGNESLKESWRGMARAMVEAVADDLPVPE